MYSNVNEFAFAAAAATATVAIASQSHQQFFFLLLLLKNECDIQQSLSTNYDQTWFMALSRFFLNSYEDKWI